jgi:hypothetical protein
MKKRGNDDKMYLSQPDKNGIYKWINAKKNKTVKSKATESKATESKATESKATKEDLQRLVKKYEVTRSGSNREVAERLVKVKGYLIKNKTDRKIIEQFLKVRTQYTKRHGFVPN